MPGLTKNINRCATLTEGEARVAQRSVGRVSLRRHAIYVISSFLDADFPPSPSIFKTYLLPQHLPVQPALRSSARLFYHPQP